MGSSSSFVCSLNPICQTFLPQPLIPTLYNTFTIVLHKRLCAYLLRAAHTPACWIGTKRNKDFTLRWSMLIMGYISDSARNRTHNLLRHKREPILLGHSDGHCCVCWVRSPLMPVISPTKFKTNLSNSMASAWMYTEKKWSMLIWWC